MKDEALRRKPRVNLNIPAVLRLNHSHSIHCRLCNASIDGFGVEVSASDLKKIRALTVETSELFWAPVPSMPLHPWKVKIKRIFGKALGLELQKSRISSPSLKVLGRLIHFHLK